MVYAIRTTDGLIKVGYTANFAERKSHYGINRWNAAGRVLFVVVGSAEQERDIHRDLSPHRARRREYYHPATDVLAYLDAWHREASEHAGELRRVAA